MIKELSKRRLNRGQIVIIAFIWLLLFSIPILFGEHPNGLNWDHIRKIWTEYLLVFAIFLLNRLLLIPRLFFKGKKALYFISILAIIALFISMVLAYSIKPPDDARRPLGPVPPAHFEPAPGFRPPPLARQPREFIPAYANLLILTILLIGFDSGLMFFSKWMQSEQNKLKAERESIKNKMDFLRTQISPHFFMNTLNNIHSLVDINTDQAKESIIKLSQLMDYMLYESQSYRVPINKEMDFIRSYMDLMKLRYTDNVDIFLDIPLVMPSVTIPPLLTISFIENAFKYGISYESPSFIHIQVDAEETEFLFKISNSIHPGKEKRKHSGIGIENTRKRLALIYGNDYTLSINSNNKNTFEVSLTIPV